MITIKVMVISDLHYDKCVFKDVDQSKAWEWLLSIVDYHRPNLLVSLGDWGEGINEEEFYQLLKKVRVWSIFGNHENLEVLKNMYNILTENHEPVLMRDGEVREFNGVRFGAINGIIALRRREKKGVPRKRPEMFIEIAKKLENKNIDILLMHETPYLPQLFPFMRDDFASRTALEAIKIIKPKLVVNGHMHAGGYKTHTFPWRTKYIYIDSSQQNRHYLVFRASSNSRVEVWRDFERIDLIELT